ncbi:porin family protein [Pontibacter harenae]|uniref:porin family protein n=1 Tax=Pontibacter harenae TaxID=2894083 RepID=UPI001E2C4C43|nr:porin family protein [Pontibacter harenae]MCC9166829.1 PorT family protein [Pontibacter harenae]
MKKSFLLVLFALMSSAAFAQFMGIKGGANYSSFKGDDAKNFDYRMGYTAGLMYQQHINSLVGIQIEALYTSKGAKIKNTNTEEIYRLNYVDVPFLLHFSASGMFVDVGPQVSFITKGRYIRETTSGSSTTTVDNEITDLPYPTDFSYVAGLGFRNRAGLGIELRYNGGFKNLFDEGSLTDRKIRNSGFKLMLSYIVSH